MVWRVDIQTKEGFGDSSRTAVPALRDAGLDAMTSIETILDMAIVQFISHTHLKTTLSVSLFLLSTITGSFV